jgi:DNA-binding PadR family transcriptional regulator
MKMNNSNLSNSELLVLAVLIKIQVSSGYKLNSIIKKENFNKLFQIGQTSVYKALNNLEKKQLAKSKIERQKTGKGAIPINYFPTKEGERLLEKEIVDALSFSNIFEERFDIALLFSDLVPSTIRMMSLKKRRGHLHENLESLLDDDSVPNIEYKKEYEQERMKSEIALIDSILQNMERQAQKDKVKSKITTKLVTK